SPSLRNFSPQGENRLVSSASLSLLSFGVACIYSEPREGDSFNPSDLKNKINPLKSNLIGEIELGSSD
ncbi:MAG: hypothetical protein COA80_18475, partial [Leeuwenhoekiella sp.]